MPKKGILSLTKVKLSVGGCQHGFKQVSHIFLYPLFFWLQYCRYLNVCYFCYLKFNVFDKHREKCAKPDFIKFISLEKNYFVRTVCF